MTNTVHTAIIFSGYYTETIGQPTTILSNLNEWRCSFFVCIYVLHVKKKKKTQNPETPLAHSDVATVVTEEYKSVKM